jgi:serine/threonine protein phosphatase PrpC
MSTEPLPNVPPSVSNLVIVCPECTQENSAIESYCVACGAAFLGDAPDPVLLPLAVGTTLSDLYVIETSESCGRENRYTAHRHNETGGRVLLRERGGEDADLFRALLERTAEVTHPAVLVPLQYFEHGERGYLVYPELQGIKLAERIGRTSEREAIGWGIQLCQILGFLHRRSLLCVELPPEGVLLNREGRVCLTHLDAFTPKGTTPELGFLTDGYVAPEVYKPGELTEQADVFALGALLYTVLVGKRLPVEGWLVHPELPEFYPEKVLSPGLERILRKALAFDPQDRYANVDTLKSALLALSQTVRVRSAWLTDLGHMRDHNEDAVLVKEYGHGTVEGGEFSGLYIVSDGMGGAEAGEVASALAIRTVAAHFDTAYAQGRLTSDVECETCLREAVEVANTVIHAYGKEHREAAGLGATVVAALVQNHRFSIAWVGDSRGYLWERGKLQQLSRDHSLVARLVEIGQITPDEARTHEHRNVLIRSLGSKEQVVVDTLSHPLVRGTRLILCSDGLTTHVEDHALADIVSRHREPGDAALELVAAANAGGGSDNISVIVVFYE